VAQVLLSAAVAVAAGALALVGKAVGPAAAPVPMSPFGGSVPVHIAHVGHIEVDLESSPASSRLDRVRCAGAARGTACFVSR